MLRDHPKELPRVEGPYDCQPDLSSIISVFTYKANKIDRLNLTLLDQTLLNCTQCHIPSKDVMP